MRKWKSGGCYSVLAVNRCMNCIGKSGGICVMWKSDMVIDLLIFSQDHINMTITEVGGKVWRLTGFYGRPERSLRCHSWTLLKRLVGMAHLPWVCIGDFDEILSDSDKFGGADRNWRTMSDFRETLEDCELENMGFIGPRFTWSNKKAGNALIMERLDRSFCHKGWKVLFPHSFVRHLDF
ncbi:hypothetical protein Dsin_016779 [Dipteronia sinensis]|uniref:Endonuclease/exonuclease/phosphatase domain-containing protein n=1 Tax=Dipteronia sinensis TaxID=43782 RepID=A0AAE0AEK0_9ROSI|nr:hypothetical protein Dsin_016779 [Dipteronia sinensis]